MLITNDIIEYGKSDNGGWSLKQLRVLGLTDEFITERGLLKKGWKSYLIGMDVPVEIINRFYELRNAHIARFREKTKRLAFG